MIFVGWIYVNSNLQIMEELNRYIKIISHKITIFNQNQKYKNEIKNKKKYYDKQIEVIKKENERKIKELVHNKDIEIKKIENKYNKIQAYLDNIKNKADLLNFLNNIK